MNSLKTVTLLAGISQIMVLVCGLYNYLRMIQRLQWQSNADYFLVQPVYLFSEAVLAVFFFVLFSRQKPG